MDYKKIIKSRRSRLKLLYHLRFIPDRTMLKLQYRIKLHRKLNLRHPKRFSEKLQWYKLYYKDPLLVQCADKGDVRDYVKSKGLEDILIPCFGIYDSADDVPWDDLPDRFVMKDTLGGGGTSVVLVRDKSKEDMERLRSIARSWTRRQLVKGAGREWPYYNGKQHRIIIEELLDAGSSAGGVEDYKFFCIHGRTAYLNVMGDRDFGRSVKATLFDRDFNRLPVIRVGDEIYEKARKPANYDELLATAEKLAEDFPHVRVDLYDIDGRILFGELTFYSSSGYMEYDPDSFDTEIGSLWDLEKSKPSSAKPKA